MDRCRGEMKTVTEDSDQSDPQGGCVLVKETITVTEHSDQAEYREISDSKVDITRVKQLEEDLWYRNWVDRNTIRYERAKAVVA